jgi:hypothetical protein
VGQFHERSQSERQAGEGAVLPATTLQCPGTQVIVIESATGTLDLVYQGEVIGQIPVNYAR